MSEQNSTASLLALQWENPSDVMTVLMIIGGDVIQRALAQTAGCLYTPVCFSFGWVSYSFMALIGVLGDGRLLPEPDVACKVINLESGYARDNKNWVIGRLVRDLAGHMERIEPMCQGAIRISVWEALENPKKPTEYRYWSVHAWGLAFMIIQLVVAAIPMILFGDWSVLLVTGVGTLLSLVTGALPQWTAEKLPNSQDADFNFALTTGNGSKDVMVILGGGKCLHLERLSVTESPRSPKPWEKFIKPGKHLCNNFPRPFAIRPSSLQSIASGVRGGLPIGFQITYFVCIAQAILWLGLLVTVSALQSHTWYLLVVGLIGMFQNAFLAAIEVRPEHRNIPLKLKETIIGSRKVMDAIMDLHAAWGCGKHLVPEFFPGPLRQAEKDWWDGNTAEYDEKRTDELLTRGLPRTVGYYPNAISGMTFHPKKVSHCVALSKAATPKQTQIREQDKLASKEKSHPQGPQAPSGSATDQK